MKDICFICLLFFWINGFSQNPFASNTIPTTLQTGANAVIRLHSIDYHIKTKGRALKEERLVVTVLNEKGEDLFSSFTVSYDRFHKIKDFNGAVYDASGKKAGTLKKSDIRDYSNFDPSYQVTDQRQKIASFDRKKYVYPYTIEFSSAEEINTGMFYPAWAPVCYEKVGIERSVFTITAPTGLTFRYKELNLPEKVKITTGEHETVYSWLIENKPPFEFEEYMSGAELPVVYTAPDQFEVDGYEGNASSWKNIGKFYSDLNKDRDQLPESLISKIEELIGREKDTLKKIQALYSYMQSKTRYISIQLGIGGWQSMKAMDVEQKGYGDCKALSNYMVALLKQAHIKAYPVLILAGKEVDQQNDFPSFRFNHCIVCVPGIKDSLWLECTSQKNPMGYLGSFTGNRKALMVTEDGGVLVNTSAYSVNDNVQQRKTMVQVKENGDAQISVNTVYKGILQEPIDYIYDYLSKEEQRKAVVNRFRGTELELQSFSFYKKEASPPEISESLRWTAAKLLPQNNDHVVITPNLFPDGLYIPELRDQRAFSVYLNPNTFNYSKSDTIIYDFAKALNIESLPKPVHIKNDFGEYKADVIYQNNNHLIYCRKLVVRSGKFPADRYTEWLNFIKQINKSDKVKVVFVSK